MSINIMGSNQQKRNVKSHDSVSSGQVVGREGKNQANGSLTDIHLLLGQLRLCFEREGLLVLGHVHSAWLALDWNTFISL